MANLGKSACTLSLLALACSQASAQQIKVDNDAIKLEKVEVVGSHLRRVDMETQHPVLVIEREALLKTGLTDIADILQTISSNGQSLNRNINNGGTGEARINLRSLGENRSLVLVDGHRLVSALDGGVDLTAIPLALVQRVEVLRDGASAIYGSDAIAGVVNIVTRRDYNGGEASAYFGENSYNDGQRRTYDLTWGKTGEGWNVAGGVAYSKDEATYARDRAISRVPYFGLPLQGTGSLTTGYSRLVPESYDDYIRLIEGRSGTSPDDFRPVNPVTDGYNYTLQNYLQTPQERRALFAQARYDFSTRLGAHVNVLHNERRSAQQLAEPVVSFNPFQDGPAGLISISPDNIYNPFGEAIPFGNRRFVEAGPRRLRQEVDTTRIDLGLDGLFALGAREFSWGLNYTGTRADQREWVSPYADNSRLALALGPSFRDAAGVAHCGRPDAVIAGCVPLNLIGPPGSITPEMLAYVGIDAHNRKRSESRDLVLHAEGSVLDLPAGELGIAVGVERREEEGYNRPDAAIARGDANGTGVTYDATQGSYSVNEAFVELNLPLLKDLPLARQLDVSLASRYSDYSEFGGTTNSQFGLRWKPVEDVLVRGNIAQGFRAPSLLDLYSGAVDYVGLLQDPCSAEHSPSASTLARCQALGVPVGVQDSELVNITTGGNRQLQPERALSRSLGLVYSPHWLEGLEANIDWYRVQIRDAIGDRDSQAVVDDCYVRADPNACARIQRLASDGTLARVLATAQNLPGGLETEGFDFGLSFRRSTSAGDFHISWDNAYVSYYGELHQPVRASILPDGTPAQGNVVSDNRSPGSFYGMVWRLRSNLRLDWQHEAWNHSVGVRYFSPTDEDCSNPVDYAEYLGQPQLANLCSNPNRIISVGNGGEPYNAPENRMASVTYFDLETSWDSPWKARFTLGVRNAFDRDPPVSYSAFMNSSQPDYDIPGRFWYASYRQSF